MNTNGNYFSLCYMAWFLQRSRIGVIDIKPETPVGLPLLSLQSRSALDLYSPLGRFRRCLHVAFTCDVIIIFFYLLCSYDGSIALNFEAGRACGKETDRFAPFFPSWTQLFLVLISGSMNLIYQWTNGQMDQCSNRPMLQWTNALYVRPLN